MEEPPCHVGRCHCGQELLILLGPELFEIGRDRFRMNWCGRRPTGVAWPGLPSHHIQVQLISLASAVSENLVHFDF